MRAGWMRPSATRRSRASAGDLAAHRVEAGEDDRLGRVVDDDVHAGDDLEGADVAALAADDAPLHVVAGQVHDRDRRLGDVVGGVALDREADDLAGLALGVALGGLADLGDAAGGLGLGLVLDVGHQAGARLVRAHPGDALELHGLLADQLVELAVAQLDRRLALAQLVLDALEVALLLLDQLDPAAERGLLLVEGALGGELGVAGLLGLALDLLLEPQRLLAALQHGVAARGLGLALGLLEHVLGAVLRALEAVPPGARPDEVAEDECDGDAREGAADPDGQVHGLSRQAVAGAGRAAGFPPGRSRRGASVRSPPRRSGPGAIRAPVHQRRLLRPGRAQARRGSIDPRRIAVCGGVLETWRTRWVLLRPGGLTAVPGPPASPRGGSRGSVARRRRPPEVPCVRNVGSRTVRHHEHGRERDGCWDVSFVRPGCPAAPSPARHSGAPRAR